MSHAQIQKVLSEGSHFENVFFLFLFFLFILEGREYLNKYHFKRAIIDPPAKRHFNDVLLMGWWWPNIERWNGYFVILRGSGPVLLRSPIFFKFSRGGGPDPLSPFGSAHVTAHEQWVHFRTMGVSYNNGVSYLRPITMGGGYCVTWKFQWRQRIVGYCDSFRQVWTRWPNNSMTSCLYNLGSRLRLHKDKRGVRTMVTASLVHCCLLVNKVSVFNLVMWNKTHNSETKLFVILPVGSFLFQHIHPGLPHYGILWPRPMKSKDQADLCLQWSHVSKCRGADLMLGAVTYLPLYLICHMILHCYAIPIVL